MTSTEADQTLARLNRHLAILSAMEARPGPVTAEELEVVKIVQAKAAQALAELQAHIDCMALIERIRA